MIVVDASVLVAALAGNAFAGAQARNVLRDADGLAAPDLVDVETVAALRKHWLTGALSEGEFSSAVDDLEDLEIARFPGIALMRRAFELRETLTPYDAAYVALAEALGCPLVTGDRRLARAPSVACDVELI